MERYFVLLAAIACFIGRIFIHPRLTSTPSFEGIFEAFAHIFIGYIIASLIFDKNNRKFYWIILTVLSLWELFLFLGQRFGIIPSF